MMYEVHVILRTARRKSSRVHVNYVQYAAGVRRQTGRATEVLGALLTSDLSDEYLQLTAGLQQEKRNTTATSGLIAIIGDLFLDSLRFELVT
jgi:hypothetical protein